MLQITPQITISEKEISFTFSRSSGPGGQHVNKVNTRVTLWFDVQNTDSLTPGQKKRIYQKLTTRINKNGQLRVISYRHRSQTANREAAVARFITLLQDALHKEKPRKKTKLPRGAKERRLAAKKRRGSLKKVRGGRVSSDD